MKKIIFIIAFLFAGFSAFAQQPWSQRMAETAMKIWPDSTGHWSYESGVFLQGITNVWEQTAEKKYFRYVQAYMDKVIADDGSVKGYKKDDYTLDNVECARIALMLYKVTEKDKYYKAALQLRQQLTEQP